MTKQQLTDYIFDIMDNLNDVDMRLYDFAEAIANNLWSNTTIAMAFIEDENV